MRFYKAGPDDAETLTALRLAYIAEDHDECTPSEVEALRPAIAEYLSRHVGRDLLAYLAVEGGKGIAAVMLLTGEKPPSPSCPNGRTGTLLSVYTAPAFRRRGIASHLVGMAEEDAAALGLSCIDLKATPSGKPLYEKSGFRVNGEKYIPMRFTLKRNEERA